MHPPAPPLLRAELISGAGLPPLGVLRATSLVIEPGRFTLLFGPAGGGAALLLRMLGLLDRPANGELWIEGRATAGLDEEARLFVRNTVYGFIFAEPFLLDSFSVAENVAMPLFKISALGIDQARDRTAMVLDFAGLSKAADAPVSELSQLDCHRVAIARALVNAPRILIAEEAGLQLGGADLRAFAALLRAAPERFGVSVIATSTAAADLFSPDREVRVEEGLIASDSRPVPLEAAPAR